MSEKDTKELKTKVEDLKNKLIEEAKGNAKNIENKLIDEAKKKAKRAKRFPYVSLNTLISEKTNIEYKIVFYTYQHGDWDRPRMFIYTKYTHERHTIFGMTI